MPNISCKVLPLYSSGSLSSLLTSSREYAQNNQNVRMPRVTEYIAKERVYLPFLSCAFLYQTAKSSNY